MVWAQHLFILWLLKFDCRPLCYLYVSVVFILPFLCYFGKEIKTHVRSTRSHIAILLSTDNKCTVKISDFPFV